MTPRTSSRFADGAYVWASRRGQWWRATILRANEDGTYRVRFHDWEESSGECVDSTQIAVAAPTAPGREGRQNAGAVMAVVASVLLFALVFALAVARDLERATLPTGRGPTRASDPS